LSKVFGQVWLSFAINNFQFPDIVDELEVEFPADRLIVCIADIRMRLVNEKDFVHHDLPY